MENRPEIEAILRTLKYLMKQKRMRYHDLCQPLKLSESAVKRSFTNQKLEFQKVSVICQTLGISLFDLMKLASEYEQGYHLYTEAQDKLLGRSPVHHYVFIRHLVGFSTHEIQKEMGLTDKEFFKILRDLDKSNLIELQSRDRVLMRVKPPFKLRPKGFMESQARPQAIQTAIKHFQTPQTGLAHYRELYLTPASYKEFQEQLLKLSYSFFKRVSWEVLQNKVEDLIPVTALFYLDEFNCMKALYERSRVK